MKIKPGLGIDIDEKALTRKPFAWKPAWSSNLFRRRLMKTAKMLLIAISSALLAIGSARAADDFPNRPIRLIVPTQAGSALDMRMRHFTNAVKRELGWTFVVEAKPGAGQSIGMAFVANAAPDGYTIVVVNNSITLNPYLQTNPGYDPFKSFVPITQFLWAPLVLVGNVNSEIRNVQQLVAMAKAKPGEVNHASSGLGSTPFIANNVPPGATSPPASATNSGSAENARDTTTSYCCFSGSFSTRSQMTSALPSFCSITAC